MLGVYFEVRVLIVAISCAGDGQTKTKTTGEIFTMEIEGDSWNPLMRALCSLSPLEAFAQFLYGARVGDVVDLQRNLIRASEA